MSDTLSSNSTLLIKSKRKKALPIIAQNKSIKTRNIPNNFTNSDINYNRYNLKRVKSFINKQHITEFGGKNLIKNNSLIIKGNKINQKENLENNDSHNTIITNLLNNAKNFFDNLGNYLEENKPQEIPHLNANKIYPKLSTVKKKDILYPKTLKNKENDISKLYGRMYSLRILNNDNKKNKNSSNNINNISNTNINDISNENDNNVIAPKKYYFSKNNKKLVNDEIIQTFYFHNNKIIEEKKDVNENNNNNRELIDNKDNINYNEEIKDLKNYLSENQKYYLNNNKVNNNFNNKILQRIYIPKFLNIDGRNEQNNKDVKIAEIREVYPSYPFNRIFNLNSNRNSRRKNKFNNHGVDIKFNFGSDSRYYYEKLMKKIKYGDTNIRENIEHNYRINFFKKKLNSNNKVKNIFI